MAPEFVDLSWKEIDSFGLLLAGVYLTRLPVSLLQNPQMSLAVDFLVLRRRPRRTTMCGLLCCP